MEKKQKKSIILIFIIFIIMICFFEGMREELSTTIKNTEKTNSDNTFKIISSTENKDIEEIIQNYAKRNNIDVSIDYAGTIEIMSKLNNGEKYDAVWCSNSIWLYMLDSKIKTTNSKSTSINPVVFGIKKSKDEEWNLAHGTDEVDIANCTFEELPSNWQYENLEAGRVAIGLVYEKVLNGE